MTTGNKPSPPSKQLFLPWSDLMRVAMGQLQLSPAQFWASTPKEIKAMMEGAFGTSVWQPMPKDVFDQLQQKFPDEMNKRARR